MIHSSKIVILSLFILGGADKALAQEEGSNAYDEAVQHCQGSRYSDALLNSCRDAIRRYGYMERSFVGLCINSFMAQKPHDGGNCTYTGLEQAHANDRVTSDSGRQCRYAGQQRLFRTRR